MQALPPLDCLRFFATAARHESFTRGAEELRVTAAAVAHRVRMLKADLCAPLFDRQHRRVRLNSRGRKYYADFQRALNDIRQSTERARGQRNNHRS